MFFFFFPSGVSWIPFYPVGTNETKGDVPVLTYLLHQKLPGFILRTFFLQSLHGYIILPPHYTFQQSVVPSAFRM